MVKHRGYIGDLVDNQCATSYISFCYLVEIPLPFRKLVHCASLI